MKKLIIPILLCLFLTSCYDSLEIDDLAYVIGLGIDKGEAKEYKITFQYAVPINITPEGGGEGKPLSSLSFETDSLLSAVSFADSKLAKITDLSHLNLIVFSEEVAKNGILPLKTDFYSSVKTVPDAMLAVCKGKAEEFFDAVSSPLELNPSKFYENFFQSTISSPYTVKQSSLEFFNGKTDFAVPYLIYDKSISSGGMAAFKNGKLISLFTLEETLIYNLLKGEFTNMTIETEKGIYSIDSELPPKYSVDIKKPLIKIKLNLSGEAKTGDNEILKDQKSANQNLTHELKKRILLFLSKTQKENCDILTISSHAKRKFLTASDFENYSWDEKYKNAKFDVSISFKNTKNTNGGY